jgi:Cu-Zn family superoxide dismutase
MRKATFVIMALGYTLLAAALIFLSSLLMWKSAMAGERPAMAEARIIDASGRAAGMAVLTEGHDGVWIAFNLHGLPPGAHALHIHAAGKCEPPFKTAMGHFNPFQRKHGLKNPEGSHAGDLPNVLVGPDGTAAGVRLAPLVTLGEGKNSLFQPEGTAIVIHQDPDDHMTDPAGAAGPRIACGVIMKAQ